MSVLPFARQLFRTLIISLPIVSVAATTSVDATDSGVVVLPLGPAYATETADTRVPAEPVESTAPVMTEGEDTRPVTIAMLMPSDESPFLPAARIVGNGLLTASRVSSRNANIMLIEAPESVPINEMIDTAVFSGADVVVGPLQKDQVEQLSREKNLPIPIVTLNYAATPDEEISPNMLMLSVATDLEAEYIARQAVKALPEETAAGLPPKVLILTTDKPWEKRLSEAYMKVLNLSGVQYEVFTVTMDNLQDLQDKCRPELSQEERYKFNRMAATADSERARKQVHEAQRAHAAVAAPPYHSVLLALDARDAGLVRSRLPLRTSVWATSTTNPGDPKTSSSASALAFDLNHVVFAECPFILRYDNESFEAKFQTALPYSMPAKRLFALGLDAYQVAEDWAHGRKAFEISGETGQLTVHRDLSAQVVRTPASFEIRSGELVDTAVDSEVPDETAAEGEVEPNMGAPEPIEPEVLQEDDTTQNSNI